jgi:hypothetical protein
VTTCQRTTSLKSPNPPWSTTATALASPALALKLVGTALPMALFVVADSDTATLAPTNPMAMAIQVPDTEVTELATTEDFPEQAMPEQATTVNQSMEECNKFTEEFKKWFNRQS